MFKNRYSFKKTALMLAIMFIFGTAIAPFAAASTVDTDSRVVVHYSELESTHFYGDEFSKVGIYYIYRAMMYYELALHTGSMEFLAESKKALEDLSYNLEVLALMPICARDLQSMAYEMDFVVEQNVNIINDLMLEFESKKITSTNTSDIKAFIAEADALNGKIISDLNSLIEPSKLDLMSLADMSFAVHAVQQTLMLAVYTGVVNDKEADAVFAKMRAEDDELAANFNSSLARTVSKTSDVVYKNLKNQIGINFGNIRNEENKLISKILNYQFPDKRVITVENDFIYNCFKMDNRFRNDIIGVEFT